MLQIRKEQMDVLDACMLRLFVDKMIVHMREVFPEETKDKDRQELRGLVEEGVKRASGYGITEEPQVALLIDLMVGMGHDFEKQTPWMEKILLKETLNQQEKMDIICKRLRK